MGGNAGWLTKAIPLIERSRDGIVSDAGRHPWTEILKEARELAAELPKSSHGWVVPNDGSVASVVGLVALGLCSESPRWVLGDPHRWSTGRAFRATLWEANAATSAPSGVLGTTYATATSGSTGEARLLFGRPQTLNEAVRLYTESLPEYADAEVFATCAKLDFAAAFYMIAIPALMLGRDLLLFKPHNWALAKRELARRRGVCLAPPALAVLGAGTVDRPSIATPADGAAYAGVCFVPAGGGLTEARADLISTGFQGCTFLTMLGSTETGLLTFARQVDDRGTIGRPLPGKPVWLEAVAEDGVGVLWTRGPDTRFAASSGPLRARCDGAVSAGDLAHVDPHSGGYVFDGRADDLIKVDGVSIYPFALRAALLALPGASDAQVFVNRSIKKDQLIVLVIGAVTEESVRARCAELPHPIVPTRVVIRSEQEAINSPSYNERGKARI